MLPVMQFSTSSNQVILLTFKYYPKLFVFQKTDGILNVCFILCPEERHTLETSLSLTSTPVSCWAGYVLLVSWQASNPSQLALFVLLVSWQAMDSQSVGTLCSRSQLAGYVLLGSWQAMYSQSVGRLCTPSQLALYVLLVSWQASNPSQLALYVLLVSWQASNPSQLALYVLLVSWQTEHHI